MNDRYDSPLGYFFSRFITERSSLSNLQKEDFKLIVQTLLASMQEGNTCIDLTEDQENLLYQSRLVSPTPITPLVISRHRLYLARYYNYENQLAVNLSRLADISFDVPDINGLLDRCFDVSGKGDSWQREAGRVAISKALCFISGGPGTGKTTTVVNIAALLLLFHGIELRVALAAPTGKAAARLKESVRRQTERLVFDDEIKGAIPSESQTLHRLLGVKKFSPMFRHHRKNPLPWDVVIVDEASMVDLALMSKLVDALSPNTRLILLGDKNQLASVESGAVLSDCITALPENVVELQTVYRFNQEISIFAEYINKGSSNAAIDMLESPFATSVVKCDATWLEYGGDKYSHYMTAAGEARTSADLESLFSLFAQFRILCSLRQGGRGVRVINDRIVRYLASKGFDCDTRSWYVGKTVIITRNDYSLGLYNGDIGICLPDFDDSDRMQIWFEQEEGGYRGVAPTRLPAFDPAWAMTVHKSQGSEFDEVLVILPEKDHKILSRELLYTAVTRARYKAMILGSKEVCEAAINRRVNRFSGLVDKLQHEPGRRNISA